MTPCIFQVNHTSGIMTSGPAVLFYVTQEADDLVIQPVEMLALDDVVTFIFYALLCRRPFLERACRWTRPRSNPGVLLLYSTWHVLTRLVMTSLPRRFLYSSISSSPPCALAFCRPLDFGTEASLSIICRETETMLSSISC